MSYRRFYEQRKFIRDGITTQNDRIERVDHNGTTQIRGILGNTPINITRRTPKRVRLSRHFYSSPGVTFRKTPYINNKNTKKKRRKIRMKQGKNNR
jgi:hypothetical protein